MMEFGIGRALLACFLVVVILQIVNSDLDIEAGERPDGFTLILHTSAVLGMVVFGVLQVVEWAA